MATCPPKHIFYDWIRNDLPLGLKMMITAQHIELLLRRIEQHDNVSAFVDNFVEFKSQPKDTTND